VHRYSQSVNPLRDALQCEITIMITLCTVYGNACTNRTMGVEASLRAGRETRTVTLSSLIWDRTTHSATRRFKGTASRDGFGFWLK
jgi:hypothetical protein